jgi:hypothetical protein
MSFLDDLYNRRKKLADVLADEEYSGIRQIVEDLYPDRAHFIYELLQNAEDVGAREAKFMLEAGRLVFEHDGHPFDDKNVEGITNIGKGTKADQEDKIGRFGIGFKAVFAYSETPRIWSPTYAFKITDLVLPTEIPENTQIGQKTRFEFPFDNPKKCPEDAYEEIKIGLDELAETTLLFLSSLESIGWQIGHQAAGEVLRIKHSEHHIEVLKQTAGKAASSAHFLRFSDAIEGLDNQLVAIAFELDFMPNVTVFEDKKSVADQLKIIPANPGRVAVSFPAEKENSGLRFHLNAPFVPELSRASIKETPANTPLFEQLAQLAASSLHEIRDLKLLTGDFLGVLPNPQDTIPLRYLPIRDEIINEMNSKPLTPTYAKSHAPAKQLLQAKASLKTLLSEKDLRGLIEYDKEPPQWAIGASQKNSLQDRFLSSLSITEWDVGAFVELLEEKASTSARWLREYSRMVQGPDDEFMDWLAGKPVEWHQQMYALLYDDSLVGSEYRKKQFIERLKPLRIVRLNNGNYSVGNKCFFSSDGVESDEGLPYVPKGIYSSGKSKTQQENARKLLEKIGVCEVGEAEQVEAFLKQRYSPEAVKRKRFKPDRKDIERFIALVEKEQPRAELFADYYIFELADGKWGKPGQVYLDSPFIDTGLSAYYEAFGEEAQRTALAKSYEDCGMPNKKIAAFAKAVGAQTCLEIAETNCSDNPRWDYLSRVPGKRYTSPIDRDYLIPKLQLLLQEPTIKLSKLVWRTMCSLSPHSNYLQAQYRKNAANGSLYASSQLVHHLRNAAWVPQTNGDSVHPSDASRELLPEGFPFDAGQEWLKAIEFGISTKKAGEEYTKRKEMASSLSVPVEVVDFFSALPDEEREKEHKDLITYIKRKYVARKRAQRIQQGDVPYHEALAGAFSASGRSMSIDGVRGRDSSRNPSHRRDRVSEDIATAIENEGKLGERFSFTLRKKWKGKNDQVRVALTEWYGGRCQICGKTFTQRSGEPYFEGLYLVPYTTAEWLDRVGNVLCLCPWHSAMFQFGPKEIDEEIIHQVMHLKVQAEGGDGHPTIRMKLCGNLIEIEFAENHLIDLQEMIKMAQESVHEQSGPGNLPDQ